MGDPTAVEEPQAPQFSIEQQRALALARARRARSAKSVPPDEDWGRQVGLTARNIGPQAAGAVAGGAMGSVIPGVGTAFGAGMGALAATVIQAADQLGGTNYLEQIMDRIGLPKEATEEEKLVGAGVRAMAGMAGISGAARGAVEAGKQLFRAPRATAEALAASPGLGATSAASGGMAQEAVRQNPLGVIPPELGGNATEQFLANVAGAAIAPAGVAAAQAAGRAVRGFAGDVGHAAGAAFGRPESVRRLTGDVIRNITQEDAPAVRDALRQATTHVEGAAPTVGEAIAEANMKTPGRQIGGEIVKLQEQISGAPGVANVLPSKMKANKAAVEAHVERVSTEAAKLRNMAFESARRTDGPNILGPRLDLVLLKDNAQLRNNKVAIKAIDDLNKQLLRSADKRGYVDPETLYSIRQNSRQMIDQYVNQGKLSRDHAGYILSQFNKGIDKAMVDGGAVGWKSYMETFNKGMQQAEAHAERLAAMKKIGQEVQGVHPETQVRDLLPKIPTLLHRPTMMVNFVLKLIAQDASKPVIKELATRMQDPQEFLALMSRPDAAPAKQAANQVLMHAAILTNLIQRHQAEQASPPAQ